MDRSLRPMNSLAAPLTSMTRLSRATMTGVGIAWTAACQPNFVGLLISVGGGFLSPCRASGCWRPIHHAASSQSGNASANTTWPGTRSRPIAEMAIHAAM